MKWFLSSVGTILVSFATILFIAFLFNFQSPEVFLISYAIASIPICLIGTLIGELIYHLLPNKNFSFLKALMFLFLGAVVLWLVRIVGMIFTGEYIWNNFSLIKNTLLFFSGIGAISSLAFYLLRSYTERLFSYTG
ncbi:hypothetical protein [Shouchella lonarensis]|uniref:Uncharacterized protein n=1 Tax=Shouchella lonarensis TaxID=1464122 RepID=A0A1G6HCH3_9BACI|nr:hypothetical protein [Shouchella lonarensis]SDB91960.1 hypothetical protein SAMN05421737_103184 [Shouchella lonarensis]